jgi:hypothetical protein
MMEWNTHEVVPETATLGLTMAVDRIVRDDLFNMKGNRCPST